MFPLPLTKSLAQTRVGPGSIDVQESESLALRAQRELVWLLTCLPFLPTGHISTQQAWPLSTVLVGFWPFFFNLIEIGFAEVEIWQQVWKLANQFRVLWAS